VTVIGMGNPDMGDDGIGVRVAELIQEEARRGAWRRAPQVVAAGGDAVLAGACIAEGADVLLVDAVNMQAEAGAWRVFSVAEALLCREPAAGSTHALSLATVIEMARALGFTDRLRILGVQVGDVRPGRFLSPRVARCLPAILTRIREEAETLP
jgi:hydrogenase maturation protease